MHSNAKANVSLDSNTNANAIANANVLGSHSKANANVLVTHLQMHLNEFKMFWLYILFYLEKKQRNVNKHIINLFNKYSSTLL